MKTYHILFFTHLLSILFTFSPRTQISVLNTMLVKAPPVSHVHVHKIYKTGVAFFVKGFLLASVPTFKIAKTENHCFFYAIFPIREMILCLQSSIFSRNLTEIEQLLPQAVSSYGPYTETAVQSNLFTTATLGRAKVCGSCQ